MRTLPSAARRESVGRRRPGEAELSQPPRSASRAVPDSRNQPVQVLDHGTVAAASRAESHDQRLHVFDVAPRGRGSHLWAQRQSDGAISAALSIGRSPAVRSTPGPSPRAVVPGAVLEHPHIHQCTPLAPIPQRDTTLPPRPRAGTRPRSPPPARLSALSPHVPPHDLHAPRFARLYHAPLARPSHDLDTPSTSRLSLRHTPLAPSVPLPTPPPSPHALATLAPTAPSPHSVTPRCLRSLARSHALSPLRTTDLTHSLPHGSFGLCAPGVQQSFSPGSTSPSHQSRHHRIRFTPLHALPALQQPFPCTHAPSCAAHIQRPHSRLSTTRTARMPQHPRSRSSQRAPPSRCRPSLIPFTLLQLSASYHPHPLKHHILTVFNPPYRTHRHFAARSRRLRCASRSHAELFIAARRTSPPRSGSGAARCARLSCRAPRWRADLLPIPGSRAIGTSPCVVVQPAEP